MDLNKTLDELVDLSEKIEIEKERLYNDCFVPGMEKVIIDLVLKESIDLLNLKLLVDKKFKKLINYIEKKLKIQKEYIVK